MIIVYLSSRGDAYYRCSKCDVTQFVPVELKDSPFWDHYNGITVLKMIQHYLDTHSSYAQQNLRTSRGHEIRDTGQWRTQE
jgi:hypothetical protein